MPRSRRSRSIAATVTSRVQRELQAGQRRGRLSETSPAALHPVVFRQRHRSRRWTAAHPLPDNRMNTFLEFLSAAADFALTLNLKAAIVAAGFIVMLVLTRRRGARIAPEGKAPDRPRHQGLPRPCVVTQEVDLLGRTQPNNSPLSAPVPGDAAPEQGRLHRQGDSSQARSVRPCMSPRSNSL